jgi:S-adenosylmethionine synthetase
MITNQKVYTVESVTAGHPDKVCDQISDAILDACLAQDPNSRVAVESFGGHGIVVIGGEVTTLAKVDYKEVAKKLYKDIGYDQPLKFLINIVEQSPDIAIGVDTGGAGDQGIMYGYATDETPEFLPWAVVKVHALAKGLQDLRESGEILWLKPDGKTQITMDNGKVKTVLVSTQHDDKVSHEEIKKTLTEKLIKPIIGDISGVEILVNPTDRFVQGGFEADTGLTGRKIMVDTYCGLIPHGGGCFSGKDPSKVDRSAAYMARFAAKNMVANGYAKKCLVSVAYAIGKADPLMIDAINEDGNSLSTLVKEKFDFRPLSIIKQLDLRKPIYQKTASYGHFGKAEFPWEKVIKI